ncbi:hypothetical protein KR018_001758 [Drosophila ironensis]|nr:hypothetical protein KR018_001758 [Drosophila ironensis]
MSHLWWIFVATAFLALSGITPANADADENSEALLGENEQQLNQILEAINELEKQKWDKKKGEGADDTINQRPNSKRLRWNQKRILPDPEDPEEEENRGLAGYSSSYTNPPNPDYLSWKTYEPTEAPWWFN